MRWKLLGLLGVCLWGCAEPMEPEGSAEEGAPVVEIVVPEPPGHKGYGEEDKGPDPCPSGCSLKNHPLPPFTETHFHDAMAAWAKQDPAAESEALEKLLFHGPDTKHYIERFGTDPLPEAHARLLRKELERGALVAMRLIDDRGRVRVSYGPERVPFGKKQHLHAVPHGLGTLEFNGTVMRVGRDRIWSRY